LEIDVKQAVASLIASGSHLHVARLASSPKRPYLLGANDLTAEELGGGVGEVLHVVHDGLGGIAARGLLEVIQAGPLEGCLDSIGRVISELDDLFCFVSQCTRRGSCNWKKGVAYLPGLEAVGRPVLLDEGHVSLEVVVHVEVGSLLVEYYKF
jgi:hypothetical protein